MASQAHRRRIKKEWQVKPIEYWYYADENLGQLKGKKFNTEGLVLKLTQLLFVDDSYFPFNTQEDLIKGANEIYFLFKKFGLLMHIGRGDNDSKIKAMYFPLTLPKKRTKKEQNQWHHAHNRKRKWLHMNPQNVSTSPVDTSPSLTPSYTWAPSSPLTCMMTLTYRCISWKPLHKWELTGALRSFFRHPYIDLMTKMQEAHVPHHAAQHCPLGMWIMVPHWRKQETTTSLPPLHSLRKILNINMFEVKEQRITNVQIQQKANIPDILIFLKWQQLRWVGKLARMPMDRLPRRLLVAWAFTCTSPCCSTPSSGDVNHGPSLKKTRDNYKSTATAQPMQDTQHQHAWSQRAKNHECAESKRTWHSSTGWSKHLFPDCCMCMT